ncbi:putative disease resistance protein RGA1 [Gossypium hirsutum]|uniref:Disease resistance protein RGA1 n=1 Tax=Gossypium hirsutum TaxID=3635 RepID=A0A1U8L918_GOSHI|nr:putative disease resistance protein RGA1 [Gossypium hirsutum]
MVFNDEKLGDHFALKMWVCVSEKFELKVIVEKVIEAATKTKPERDLQLETLQHHLRDSIKGKKYLLVLDDVWNDDPEKWRNLRNLLSGGARGGWIVITTRSRFVAEITGSEPHHNLRGLSGSESWSLLKQTAFKEASRESNNSRIEAIGMEIVDKCKGVPLALRAIEKVLYKRTEAEWVKVNKNVHKYLTHEEGFVQPLSEDKDLEDTGYEYFKDLVWRSFLDCESMDYLGKSWFTMHDLMHDLACSVAGKEYCIVSLEKENVSERSRHVSFGNSSGEMGNTLLKATKVRSFAGNMDLPLYQQNYMASIANCKYLRMLDLSGSDIKMLPHSIGNLKHLKALYLSGNRYLLKLPSSLSRLQLLETLDLNGCSNFRTLPNKTSRLVSLKHLLIDGCHKLDYMPRGLGKLTRLQALRWFVVGRTTGKNVGQLSELNGLNKLKGELHILGLQNAIAKHGSTYLKDKLNLKSLVLGWGCRGGEDETHLQPLHQLYSLKVIRLSRLEALEIVSETEMQELVSGKSTTTFLPSLEELEINDCPNLKGWWKGDVGEASNPHLPCFPCLSHLIIKHCPNLTTMPLFPSVKTLKLKNTRSKPFQETMKLKMTKIEAPSSSTLHPLSKLVSLEIDEVKDLHSLQEEFLQNLTSLQTLMIRECINLTSMPEGMPGLTSLNHLEIIDCPQLSKRCQRNTGLDWPKIAHIERIRIEEGGIVEHYRGSRGTN